MFGKYVLKHVFLYRHKGTNNMTWLTEQRHFKKLVI